MFIYHALKSKPIVSIGRSKDVLVPNIIDLAVSFIPIAADKALRRHILDRKTKLCPWGLFIDRFETFCEVKLKTKYITIKENLHDFGSVVGFFSISEHLFIRIHF